MTGSFKTPQRILPVEDSDNQKGKNKYGSVYLDAAKTQKKEVIIEDESTENDKIMTFEDQLQARN